MSEITRVRAIASDDVRAERERRSDERFERREDRHFNDSSKRRERVLSRVDDKEEE